MERGRTLFDGGARLRPDMAHVLAHALEGLKATDEELELIREQVRLRPTVANHRYHLGNTLFGKGLLDDAIAEYREAIRLIPDDAKAHYNLGLALDRKGLLKDAIAEYREAIRLKPDDAETRFNLGFALFGTGRFDDAIAEYREAIRLKPDDAESHYNLGFALFGTGLLDDAIAEYRATIRLKQDYAEAHCNLGIALRNKGLLDDSIAEFREAIRLKPSLSEAHDGLGLGLVGKGRFDDAIAECREAIRLKPDYAEAHNNLGLSLRSKGNYAEALAEFKRGHELGSKRPGWRYPSAQWIRDTERQLKLAERLPGVLKGEDKPKDTAEELTFAQICYDKASYASSAKFSEDAFRDDPKLADDLIAGNRYNAACSAVLASSDRAKDDPKPSEEEKTRLRKRAIEWLKADLAFWTKLVANGNKRQKAFVNQTLEHWKVDADLKGVREPAELAKLPEGERPQWSALWAEVDGLIEKAK